MAKKKKIPKPNKEYTLSSVKSIDAEKLILGLDPGSRNFGISLVGIKNKRIIVYANSVMMNPVNNLINFIDSSDLFLSELSNWLEFQPDGIIAERFQTRGNGGPLIEMVSSMLGLIRGSYPETPIKLTVASAWKNRFNRRFETDLKLIYPDIEVQPHQLDATLIGIYGLECGLETILDYEPDDIIHQVEKTSLIGLRR